jgi:segregation and condensation protein A
VREAHLGSPACAQRRIWSPVEARAALEGLVEASADWASLDEYLAAYVTEPALRATVYASSFAATLEMVPERVLEVHQHAAFAPLYLRRVNSRPVVRLVR